MINARYTFFKRSTLREANKKLTVSLILSTYNKAPAHKVILLSILNLSKFPEEIIITNNRSDKRYPEKDWKRTIPFCGIQYNNKFTSVKKE